MLKSLSLTTILFLAISVGAKAQIDGPDSIPIHTLGAVSTDVDADIYIWLAQPFETTFLADQVDPKRQQFTGAPGSVQITLVTIKDGQQTRFNKRITIGSAPAPPGPGPAPPGPGPGSIEEKGQAYGKILALTFAASLLEAAEEIRKGQSIEVARTNHNNRWKSKREKEFDKIFVPLLDQIIPPGTNPNQITAAQKDKYIDLLIKTARGMGSQ